MMLGVHPLMFSRKSASGPPVPTTWAQRASGVAVTLRRLAAIGDTIVCVGSTQTAIYSTNNASSWATSTTGFTSTPINSVASDSAAFVAVGGGTAAGNKIRYSTNGSSFANTTNSVAASESVYDVCKTATHWNVILLTGTPRLVRATSHAGPYTAATTPPTISSTAIGASGANVIVGGLNGEIAVSSNNGDTFSNVTSPATSQINRVQFGDGLALVVCQDGKSFKSEDNGLTWSASLTHTGALLSCHYGGGIWMIVGQGGFSAYSTDNMSTWTTFSSGMAVNILDALYNNNRWIICGASGELWTSDV